MDPHKNMKKAVSTLKSHFSDLKEMYSKSLLDTFNDYIFLWNEFDSCITAISQREHEFEQVQLVPTDTPLFQVENISISLSGKWIAISGKKGKN